MFDNWIKLAQAERDRTNNGVICIRPNYAFYGLKPSCCLLYLICNGAVGDCALLLLLLLVLPALPYRNPIGFLSASSCSISFINTSNSNFHSIFWVLSHCRVELLVRSQWRFAKGVRFTYSRSLSRPPCVEVSAQRPVSTQFCLQILYVVRAQSLEICMRACCVRRADDAGSGRSVRR